MLKLVIACDVELLSIYLLTTGLSLCRCVWWCRLLCLFSYTELVRLLNLLCVTVKLGQQKQLTEKNHAVKLW